MQLQEAPDDSISIELNVRTCFEIALNEKNGYGSLVNILAIQGRSRSRVKDQLFQQSLG